MVFRDGKINLTFLSKISAGCLVLLIFFFEARERNDFDIFLLAAKDLKGGQDIFHNLYFGCYHYYYDVLFALVLSPFTVLPAYPIKVIWLILNGYFIVKIWDYCFSYIAIEGWKANYRHLFKGICILFALAFLRDNIHLGQLTILMVFLSLLAIKKIESGKKSAGALYLALGIVIKLLPLLLLPYLALKREWKSLLLCGSFVIALLLLPGLLIGQSYNALLLKARWDIINPTNKEHIVDAAERSFHSLTTVLATLLVKDCPTVNALPFKRNIADISLQQLGYVITTVRLFLLALSLFFIRQAVPPIEGKRRALAQLYALSYFMLLIPLLFPHQQHYAFLFLWPAEIYLLYWGFLVFFDPLPLMEGKEPQRMPTSKGLAKTLVITCWGIVYFTTNSHFVLGVFNAYYDHYKTLTYGALLCIPLLMYCRPERLYGLK